MNRLYEDAKLDIGLVSQALNNTNATGKYFDMSEYHRALAILSGGAMAATKTSKIELLQASDAAGTGSKAITSANATITSGTNITEGTITLATVLNGETIVINGLTFTGHTDTTTVANREFSISGNDTADAGELVICINNSTYGVPGVTASNSGAVVTLLSTNPGVVVITVTSTDATFTIATTKAQAYVEVDNYDLDHDNDFTHVAVKVTTTANSNVAAILLRGTPRGAVTQKVGASAAI